MSYLILRLHFSTPHNFIYKVTKIINNVLNGKFSPWFVTGFADGESCFFFRVGKNKNMKIGWVVEPVFTVCLHINDVSLLKLMQTYFGGIGKIYVYNNTNEAIFIVSKLKELYIVIDHFNKYLLITQKWSDFILYKQILDLIKNKEHLTQEGLLKIANISLFFY